MENLREFWQILLVEPCELLFVYSIRLPFGVFDSVACEVTFSITIHYVWLLRVFQLVSEAVCRILSQRYGGTHNASLGKGTLMKLKASVALCAVASR